MAPIERVQAGAVYSIGWENVSGLRTRLLLEELKLRLPFLVVACAWSFAFHGISSKLWLLLSALTAVGIQYGAHIIASLMIVPGQRRLSEWVSFLSTKQGLLGRVLGPIVGELSATAEFLDRMRQAAPSAKTTMMQELDGTPVWVRTPDGVALSAVVFADGGPANNPRGCLLYCAGNAELSAFNRSWAAFSRKYRLAVVIFDYRGVGDSEGTMTRSGGVIDCAAMMAFCCTDKGLGYAPEKLLTFGHSIGGGFSTEAALSFPDSAIINDRSFGRLSETAWFHLYPPCVDPNPAVSDAFGMRLARFLIQDVVRHVACWELDSARHWLRIRNSKKGVLFHAADRIIPFPTQLRSHLVAYHGSHVFDGYGGRAGTASTSASQPLEEVALARGYAPSSYGLGTIIQLGTDAAARAATKGQAAGFGSVHGLESHYGSSSSSSSSSAGEDSHNRDLSYTEEKRFFQHIVEPCLGYTSTVGGVVRDLPAYINL